MCAPATGGCARDLWCLVWLVPAPPAARARPTKVISGMRCRAAVPSTWLSGLSLCVWYNVYYYDPPWPRASPAARAAPDTDPPLTTSTLDRQVYSCRDRGLTQGRTPTRERPRRCAWPHGQLILVIATLLLLFTAAAIASTIAKDASSSTWANTQ